MPDTRHKQNKSAGRRRAWLAAMLAVLTAAIMVVVRNQRAEPYRHASGAIFGTVYNITYQSHKDLSAGIRERLEQVDASLSPFNSRSVISAVNRNERATPDSMFTSVFNKAQEVSRETGGAFDITVAPLVNLWGFGFKDGSTPTRSAVDSIRRIIGYEKVRLQGGRVVKADPRVMLDCSAIAKGYGCDMVAALLRDNGIGNFMIEIGGEIVTSGISEKRLPWKIGVTKPDDDRLGAGGGIQTVINVTDKAMATSGNYRNFYYKDGKKYAHTIDPHTGYPVQHNILSATVLADDCATADAYATAFMVLGLEKSQEVLASHPELMAYFICASGGRQDSVWYSPSLRDKIE